MPTDAETAAIDVREQRIWWITYDADGRRHSVSSHSEDRQAADDLLKARARHERPAVPTSAPQGPVTFDDAADEIVADYQMNKKRSLRTLTIRIEKYLRPVFGHQPLTAITTPVVRVYITRRQAAGAANATINRDLITLKRMFTLAVQGGTLLAKPYIPRLKEQNVRRGFFEPEQFQRIKSHLPVYMQGIAGFAFVTGWRTPSEILPLEWRQVDLQAGEIRLDAGTTKNGDGRVFPFTAALRQVLVEQQQIAETLKARGILTSHVFCYTIGQKAGKGITEGGYNKAWRKARVAQGVLRESRTISGAPSSEIWCGRASLSVWRCSSPGTGPTPCSSATTSSAAATCETRHTGSISTPPALSLCKDSRERQRLGKSPVKRST